MKLHALMNCGWRLAPAAVMCLTIHASGDQVKPHAQSQAAGFEDWTTWRTARELVRPDWAKPAKAGQVETTFISCGEDPECDMPTRVVFSPDGQRILITHEASMNVGVYDTNTREILDIVAVTGHPYDIEVMPDGATAIVANLWDNSVSFIDYINGAELAVVPVGNYPSMVLISPDGSYAAIGNALDETWSIIDTATQQVINTVSAGGAFGFGWAGGNGGVYSWTYKSVILPDNRLVLQDWNNLQVNFVTLATGDVESVAVNANGMFLTATPDGSKVVVVHNPVPDPCSLSIIDTAAMVVDGTITAPYQSLYQNAVRPVMRPDGTGVAFWSGPTAVMIWDITDYNSQPIQSYTYGDGFIGTSDGQYLFLNRSQCSSLLEWDTGNPVLFDGAPEFCAPDDMDIISCGLTASSPVENRVAMLTLYDLENVVVFNLDGEDANAEASVPTGPDVEADRCLNMAITSDGQKAVGIHTITGNAAIFDLANDSVLGWVDIGDDPRGVVITDDDSRALITNTDSESVSVIDLGALTATEVDVAGCSGPIVLDHTGQWAYISGIINDEGVLYRMSLDTLELDPVVLDTAPAGSYFSRTIGLFLDRTWTRPEALALSNDNTTMCVCGGAAFSVIDLVDWAEDARLPLSGSMPQANVAMFSLDDSVIYLAHMDVQANDTTWLHTVANDAENSAITDSIYVGEKGFIFEMNAAGSTLYVGCRGIGPAETKKVAVVDLVNFQVDADIQMPDPADTTFQRPAGLQLSADESTLYTLTTDGFLHVIDTATNTVTESQDTGANSGCRFELCDDGRGYIVSPHGYCDGITALDLEVAPCPADVNDDGQVDIDDLFDVLGHWGEGEGQWDVNEDGTVDIDDVFAVLGDWGPC